VARGGWGGGARAAAPMHGGADRLSPSGAQRDRARGVHLVTGREAPRLPLERPRPTGTTGLGGGKGRNRATAADRAAERGRRLRGGVASRAAGGVPRGWGAPAHLGGRGGGR